MGHCSPCRTGNTFLDMPNNIGAATEEHTAGGDECENGMINVWHMELKKRAEKAGNILEWGSVILGSSYEQATHLPQAHRPAEKEPNTRHKYAIYITHQVHAHSFELECLK
jgi:hypothetical protein